MFTFLGILQILLLLRAWHVFGALGATSLGIFYIHWFRKCEYLENIGVKPTPAGYFCIFVSVSTEQCRHNHQYLSHKNRRLYMCLYKSNAWLRWWAWCRDTPGAEVLERSPDGEAGASNLDRLQHAGISELVQNQRLVELVRHLKTVMMEI